MISKKHRISRRGAAVVELAIVMPLLVFLIIGILEFGRALDVQQIITNAAREGARHAAADAPVAKVEHVVRRYLIHQGLKTVEPSATVTCTTSSNTPSGFPAYRVRVSVPSRMIQWIPKPLFTNADSQQSADAYWPRSN